MLQRRPETKRLVASLHGELVSCFQCRNSFSYRIFDPFYFKRHISVFLAWCSLKIDSYFFAIKPFGFSVLAATKKESADSFDTNVTL